MLDVHAIKPQDLHALSAGELAPIAAHMLAHISEQSKRIDSQAQAIKWRDAKIESITFQLARLKAWKFGAKIERINAEQRDLRGDTRRRPGEPGGPTRGSARHHPMRHSAPEKQPRRSPKLEACRSTCRA